MCTQHLYNQSKIMFIIILLVYLNGQPFEWIVKFCIFVNYDTVLATISVWSVSFDF